MKTTIKSVRSLAVALFTFGQLAGGSYADNYTIESSDGLIKGNFVFSGSLNSDGTFNFSNDGSPLSNANINVFNVFTFTLPGISADGVFNFASDGSPLNNPGFTFGSGTGSNLPNQNDQYQVVGGDLSSLKYDAFNNQGESLLLRLDNSYEIIDSSLSTIDSGSYQVLNLGNDHYSLQFSSGPLAFTNQPNQNDRYVISGGKLIAVKYDLFNGSGRSLNFSDNGTYSLTDGPFNIIANGRYTITPTPNPQLFIQTAVMVSFQSMPGLLYTIEESTTLTEGEWSEAVTDIQGTGEILKLFFEISEPEKFYRLQQ